MKDLIDRQAAIDALGEREELDDSWTDEYEVGRFQQWKDDVEALKKLSAVQTCDDAVSRRAAIDAFRKELCAEETESGRDYIIGFLGIERVLNDLPSAQQTLFGYKIEHLAYIARVMEKEGVTAEYAVRTFDDMSRAIRMILDEAQQKAEEMLNERFNQQTECN